jgi:hypothetical protein
LASDKNLLAQILPDTFRTIATAPSSGRQGLLENVIMATNNGKIITASI